MGGHKLFGKALAGPDIKELCKPEVEIQFIETESLTQVSNKTHNNTMYPQKN